MPIVLLLFTFALQSSVEELLFRGWLLSVLAKKFNVPVAVVVSSALFSLLHFSPRDHWLASVGTFLFALFACAWVLRTRSVLGIMGWHAGWNWLLAIGFGLPLTGLDVGIPALLVDLQPVGPSLAHWRPAGTRSRRRVLRLFRARHRPADASARKVQHRVLNARGLARGERRTGSTAGVDEADE